MVVAVLLIVRFAGSQGIGGRRGGSYDCRQKYFPAQAGAFAMDDISFDVPAGGYAVLSGRTGCGKTTILEALCGLNCVLAGSIHLGGIDVTFAAPGERDIGYVPQDRRRIQDHERL